MVIKLKNIQQDNVQQKIEENKEKTKNIAKKTINNYKNFAMKGNILDMAIGVVIGSAFTSIVNTLVTSIITPLISVLTNKVDLSTLFITLHGTHMKTLQEAKAAGAITLNYGDLLNALLNFFIISTTLFIIVSIIKSKTKKDAKKVEEIQKVTTKQCPYCLSSIPIDAIKCAHCTSDLIEKKLLCEKT